MLRLGELSIRQNNHQLKESQIEPDKSEVHAPEVNHTIGGKYLDSKTSHQCNEIGARLINKAAEQGLSAALYLLGEIHEYGIFAEQNPNIAFGYYYQAAQRQHEDAYLNVTDDNAEPVVNFNKATDGVEGSAEGTIIFSGEHTEKDLAAIIGRAPTADEIEASRTNSVACETKLHGGTMIVQNQAIFSAEKITAQADSNSTIEVKDAVLKAGTIAFDKSNELKTAGNATIEADSLTFADGSSMTMNGDGTTVKAYAITFEKGSALTLNVDMNSTRTAVAAFSIDSDDVTMDGTITLNLRFTRNLYADS